MSQNNYIELTRGLRNRLDPDNLIIEKGINEELSSISYSNVLEYVRYAMNGVEPAYTQKSKEAGEKVKTHLSDGGVDGYFKYQGSVMTNTHIKGYSDIDLLVISNKSYQYDYFAVKAIMNEPSRQTSYYPSQLSKIKYEDDVSSYTGDALSDLRKLRTDSERIMIGTYLNCDVNKPKSIKIKNTNLNREVDIVIANYYDDITSIINDKGDNRGIQVYNKDLHVRGKIDFPFVSIDKINNKSTITGGRLKKMIRFLKNLKAKSNLNIELSSFDFNAICYDIDQTKYQYLIFHQLVPVLYLQLKTIANNQTIADNLLSVDEREHIFRGKPEKLQSLRNLLIEIESVVSDLKTVYILS